MNLKKFFLLVFFIALGSLSAQNFIHGINPFPTVARITRGDTVKILAVMVEFQPDNNDNTYGNGVFGSIYSKNYGSSILDPLPHDKDYFAAHLSFAQDYFKKASGGKTVVTFKVLNKVIRLPKTMLDYSPEINSSDVSVLGGFAQDVWKAVDDLNTVDFSKYNMFVIFHAGVGRDVTMPGSLGLERDLPSVYLSYSSLKHIFGSFFEGFRVNNGNFKIKNSAIMPETESRESSSLNGTSLVQLSINGLLVSMIGSYLGLPDLYDTQTGKTAIGRFGLMDGQSIFAYGGCFPPMPSAWEKIYLGWVMPKVLNSNINDVKVIASANGSENQTIYKIPINAEEYFLVENRQRDVNGDGALLNIWRYGRTEKKNFAGDGQGFYSFDVSALYGVVTSVDEYDWALPGSGILIWHIDEKVIKDNIADNRINANSEHRGVYLEEADGIQDIGVEFQTIFGDVVVGEGEKTDFWYKGNPSKLYKNKFAPDTKPNTNSNYGGSSLITFSDFSENSKEMSFNLSFGSGIVEGKQSFEYKPSGDVASLLPLPIGGVKTDVFFTDDSSLVQVDFPGSVFNHGKFAGTGLAAVSFNNADYLVAGFIENQINIFSIKENKVVSTFSNAEIITSPPVFKKDKSVKLLAGDAKGNLNIFDLNVNGSLTYKGSKKYFDGTPVTKIAVGAGYVLAASGNALANNHGNKFNLPAGEKVEKIGFTQRKDGVLILIAETKGGNLWMSGNDFDFKKIASGVSDFAFGDLLKDGNNYIVYASGVKIYALTLTGAVAENFPYENPFGANFTGGVRTGDINNDGVAEIIAYDTNGNLFAVNSKTGSLLKNFPYTVSNGETLPFALSDDYSPSLSKPETPAVFQMTTTGLITHVKFAWLALPAPKIYWSTDGGGAENSGFLEAPSSGGTSKEFFPLSEAYNWPNPVYGGETHIRYFVNEDSKIEITIMDLSGEIVKKITTQAKGGFASEITWNVSNVQSGVYFAHINVTSLSGKSAYKIIKIAVIH